MFLYHIVLDLCTHDSIFQYIHCVIIPGTIIKDMEDVNNHAPDDDVDRSGHSVGTTDEVTGERQLTHFEVYINYYSLSTSFGVLVY